MSVLKKALVLSAVSAALLLTACSKGSSEPKAASGSGAAVAEGKTYIVAIDATYAPFEFIQNDNIVGFTRDLLDAVAQKENLKLEYKNTPWEALFASVEKGDTDIAASSITITAERAQTKDFSDSYFEATQLIVTPADKAGTIKSMADLKGHRVSVMNGSTGAVAVEKILGAQSNQIKRFENMPLALKELLSGGADASVGDNGVIQYFITNNPSVKFNTVLDPSFEKEPYGFAVRKGRQDDLLKKLNAGIAAVKSDGTYQKVYDKWFAANGAAKAAAPAAASTASGK